MKTAEQGGQPVIARRQLLTSGAALLGATGVTAASVAGAPPAAAAGVGWHPMLYRSVDTRGWGGYKPQKGDEFSLDLTEDLAGSWVLTDPAVAVSYNLTITQTEASGWLSLRREGDSWPGTSSINWWSPSGSLANGGIVELGYSYYARLLVGGGKAHFIVDITGYFM